MSRVSVVPIVWQAMGCSLPIGTCGGREGGREGGKEGRE